MSKVGLCYFLLKKTWVFKIHICMFTKTDNLLNLSKEGYQLFFIKVLYA